MLRKNRKNKKQNVAGEFTKEAGEIAEVETAAGAETEAKPAEAGEHNVNL
jgi:hypothetical protein